MNFRFSCTKDEAYKIAQLIANELYWSRCQCEDETGYFCEHCYKHHEYIDKETFEELQRRYADLVFRNRVIDTTLLGDYDDICQNTECICYSDEEDCFANCDTLSLAQAFKCSDFVPINHYERQRRVKESFLNVKYT